ncbi:MAG: tRNA uridine-5-carboxymethylaminomethyl(34) synthesis GTPase MnmE [Acidaminococcaceae bacterium]|nr:tRNA uridine-5-carboxymethylaminomethyl(34) synthesis GTPase MnmE [Acidaminococcaceae bacterium]MDD4721409.1 tRNA uridine-5-carboxymethylaminomethyl(34) synthesis GTPase MnmE [Acidaminococcaceae bacterium]
MEDTISAVATALGEGAVGIIRISGPRSLEIADKIFITPKGRLLGSYGSRHMVYGNIKDIKENIVDEVLGVFMPGPHSYTGEDVVEIQCHGGIQSLQTILRLTFAMGARPAEPGEFTKRAFLNGRMDLAQAEAVMNIIKARSQEALKLALRQQKGQLSDEIRHIRGELKDVIVHLEAIIDYPEEDIEELTFKEVQDCIFIGLNAVNNLLAKAHTGKIMREGLLTAIVGRPNVGKSSLLNCLLKEERAIVSEVPGTTRDVIQEQMLIEGVPLILTDTAGIHKTEDFVESIGVEKTKAILADAELAIVVLDGSEQLRMEDKEILSSIEGREHVIIVNKGDLPCLVDMKALEAKFGPQNILTLSVKTAQGVEEFVQWLKNFVYGAEGSVEKGVFVQNARHEQLLLATKKSLKDALHATEKQIPYDCIVIDLRNAIDNLGAITGETVQDEIINEIFARFCLGK